MLKHEQSTCIIVLGRLRSGTSLTAGILHLLGVNMGNSLLRPMPSNEKGFFEDTEFLNLHVKMTGNKWFDPDLSEIEKHLPQYRNLVNSKCNQSLWGVKDPRLCFLLPHFLSCLTCNRKLIWVDRDIEESIASVVSSTLPSFGMPSSRELAKEICERYESARLRSIESVDIDMLKIEYQDILNSPEREIAKICDFIGYWPDTAEAVGLVDRGLHHHR